jgi:hypothetical protein
MIAVQVLPVRKNVIFVIYEQLPLGMDAAVRCPRGRESGLQSHWHRQYHAYWRDGATIS